MDKPFSPSTDTPFIPENYFMQIIITKVTCKRPQPSADTKYTFGVLKGRFIDMQAAIYFRLLKFLLFRRIVMKLLVLKVVN